MKTTTDMTYTVEYVKVMVKYKSLLKYLKNMIESILKITTIMLLNSIKLQVGLIKLLNIMKNLIHISKKYQECIWKQVKSDNSLIMFKAKKIKDYILG